MEMTCGIDWAESHHDVGLVDLSSDDELPKSQSPARRADRFREKVESCKQSKGEEISAEDRKDIDRPRIGSRLRHTCSHVVRLASDDVRSHVPGMDEPCDALTDQS